MSASVGKVLELIWQDGLRHARIASASNLIPSPGQYLLVSDGSDSVLPAPVFSTDSTAEGFIAAPAPNAWIPGMELFLRGPLGRGFTLPSAARKICLVAFDNTLTRLRGLISPSLKQGAAVTIVSDFQIENLPDDIEIQPLASMGEILGWADYTAFDVSRERLPELLEMVRKQNQASTLHEAEILIRTPVPCGGTAECGVCAITTKSGWKMACKEGPVFALREI